MFHSQNYVHDNLRAQNIMVNNVHKVMIVDFDWAGVHDKAIYPSFMNPAIDWPAGIFAVDIGDTELYFEVPRLEKSFKFNMTKSI